MKMRPISPVHSILFTNSNAGGSGLTIQGKVYLYVPQGVTVTCTGANASGQTGAGAGIELASGNALHLLGSGTVNATGGNAANSAASPPATRQLVSVPSSLTSATGKRRESRILICPLAEASPPFGGGPPGTPSTGANSRLSRYRKVYIYIMLKR